MRAAALLFGACLAVAAGIYLWLADTVARPGPATSETRLIVERGSGLARVAQQLEEAEIIANAEMFRGLAMWQGADTGLQAGEYVFPAGASMMAVLDRLVEGRTFIRRLTFPEGMTTHAILERLAGEEGLTGDLPDSVPEGTLMPDTYDFSYGELRGNVLERMQHAMTDAVADAWVARDKDLPIVSPHQLVTLASIVEKETGLAGERAEVAGVFINRLRQGMKLQTDPTVIYAITGGKVPLGRGIRRSELRMDHPYNTYVIQGLPPGPIANPGRDALMAAANPAVTDALYFVADGTGGHAFARTHTEHLRNVAKWRRIERERKAANQ